MSASLQDFVSLSHLTLGDIEAMRLLLSGSSVIDWRRLGFRSRSEVDDFFRLQAFDPTLESDRARLWALHAKAVQYLELSFGRRLHQEILHPPNLEDLLLMASSEESSPVQRDACMVLKVMHIAHHLDARALRFAAPMSDRQIFALAEEKVIETIESMQGEGFPIVEVATSRKLKDSQVTKLLAKRETIAAQIFDKLRVRIVTDRREHVLPVLSHLMRHLFPFNYVIPGESRNRLVDLIDALGAAETAADLGPRLQRGVGLERGERPQEQRPNEFSGETYRDISFVVDLPVRLPEELRRELPVEDRALGPIVFAMVEFQVLDEATALANERGDGSHQAYKSRQMRRVLERLSNEPVGE